jgi:hypothetical protein
VGGNPALGAPAVAAYTKGAFTTTVFVAPAGRAAFPRVIVLKATSNVATGAELPLLICKILGVVSVCTTKLTCCTPELKFMTAVTPFKSTWAFSPPVMMTAFSTGEFSVRVEDPTP